ncbi:MAG: (d)CMP kinase [Nitrospirae bacterium]|nr:(d)CMP kinase [Nitrospirota bacterium]
MPEPKITIAVDGPSASGKTTAARLLALKLAYSCLDTGLLYRAVAWKVLKEKIDPADEAAVSRICKDQRVTVKKKDHTFRIQVENRDITSELRTPELSTVSSAVSKYKGVRESLMSLQREVGKEPGVILVGRDIGTQILPEAPVKFFMDASIKVRGERRHEELIKKGFNVSLDQTIREMSQRDRQDSERAIAPMQKAPDAIYIDTTGLSLDEVVEKMAAEVKNAQNKKNAGVRTVSS